MEFSEREWATRKAVVAIHGAVAVQLLKLHRQRADIIDALRNAGQEAGDRLLAATTPNGQINA